MAGKGKKSYVARGTYKGEKYEKPGSMAFSKRAQARIDREKAAPMGAVKKRTKRHEDILKKADI